MNLLNLATLGVRLTGLVVIAFSLVAGGIATLTQIGSGTERKSETRVDAQQTTTTMTVVQRSFDPLLLAPGGAGLALGLMLILGSRPAARILIIGID